MAVFTSSRGVYATCGGMIDIEKKVTRLGKYGLKDNALQVRERGA